MNTGMRHTFGRSKFESQFYRDPVYNTIKYKGTQAGYQEVFEGRVITAVDNTMLRNMDKANDDFTAICTTLVTDLFVFFINTDFNQPIGSWDVSNVTNMSQLFTNSPFNQPIDNWETGNVTNMSAMFRDATSFNQPIGSWDVRNVLDFTSMFRFQYVFFQDISTWCVEHITSPPYFPHGDPDWPASQKPQWGAPC